MSTQVLRELNVENTINSIGMKLVLTMHTPNCPKDAHEMHSLILGYLDNIYLEVIDGNKRWDETSDEAHAVGANIINSSILDYNNIFRRLTDDLLATGMIDEGPTEEWVLANSKFLQRMSSVVAAFHELHKVEIAETDNK